MEKNNKIKRSDLWHNIYEVLARLDLKKVEGDCLDGPSAATEIENIFYKYSKTSNENERHIPVISNDTLDFKLWKSESRMEHDGLDRPRQFKVGNTTYYCISRVIDLCSIRFDEIIETEYAKRNDEYEHIKTTARGNLTSNVSCISEDIFEKEKEVEVPYCTDCGNENLAYLDQYANGGYWRCRECKREFIW